MDQKDLEKIKTELGLGEVRFYNSLPSTNDFAVNWLEQNPPHLSLVAANEQTKGRGRYNRKWFTPPNSALAFSIILTEDLVLNQILRYSGLGALATCETLSPITSNKVEIKWPNDVLINQRKVAGILTESSWAGDEIKGIVIGIGINVSKNSLSQSIQYDFPATYLENHTSTKIKRLDLLKKILSRIKGSGENISSKHFLRAWEQNLAYKGQTVQITLSESEKVSGKLIGLSENGEAMLSFGDNKIRKFSSNQINLRPIT